MFLVVTHVAELYLLPEREFSAGKSWKIPYGLIKKYFRENSTLVSSGTSTNSSTSADTKVENLQFYHHPDHLGGRVFRKCPVDIFSEEPGRRGVSYITDASGEVYQHEEYFPLGELRS